jgi:hypothetical protein
LGWQGRTARSDQVQVQAVTRAGHTFQPRLTARCGPLISDSTAASMAERICRTLRMRGTNVQSPTTGEYPCSMTSHRRPPRAAMVQRLQEPSPQSTALP